MVQIQRGGHVLDHADDTAPTWQRDLEYTGLIDQDPIIFLLEDLGNEMEI